MKFPLTARRQDERGQVLVIVAGGILGLLVLVALVIDGSNAFLNRRDGQNVADIAALDATRLIADGYANSTTAGVNLHSRSDVANEIAKSIAANGCSAAGATPCTAQAWFVGPSATGPVDLAQVTNGGALPANTLGVRVTVNRQPSTFLAKLPPANIDTWDINTEAIALAETPKLAPAGHLLPIAFLEQPDGYTKGQTYDLTDGKDLPGGFGWLSWDGSNSAGALATSLCTPNNPEFFLPKWFPADPGKTNSSSVRACLDKWIASGQTVLIPIYDQKTGNGNNAQYQIVGIAAFVLFSRDQPAVDNIRGYFVEIYPYTNPVPGGAGSGVPQPGDTSYFLGLVR